MPESFRGGCSFGTGGNQILPALTQATLLHRRDAGKGLRSEPQQGIRDLMKTQFIFGYGSLVNQATHDHNTALVARLSGWKRIWRHTQASPAAFLSTEPDADYDIDGLILQVAHGNPELERREQAYERADVTDRTSHNYSGPAHIHTYTLVREPDTSVTLDRPILLSYLDVVVQGYFREFGEDGVDHFFETTQGWNTPILDDRAQPAYPRHQKLKPEETELTDSWLAKLSAIVKQG